MKILSITAQKPNSTGSGVYLTELVKAFGVCGHEQAIVAGVYREEQTELPENVRFYPVHYNSAELPFPIVGMSDEMPYESTRYCDMTPGMVERFERAFLKVVEKVVEEWQPDLILCHHLYLLTAIVRDHFPKHRMYGFCHNTDIRQMQKTELKRDYIANQVRLLDFIFVPQNAQKESVKRVYDIEGSKILALGMGYNHRLFYQSASTPLMNQEYRKITLIFAGKIAKKKGVISLIKSLSYLPYERDTLILKLAGGSGNAVEYEEILSFAKKAPYQVEMMGRLSQESLANAYRESDIFILPSFFDGLPLVVIEALACGNKVVITELPGVREWIEDAIPKAPVVYVPMPPMHNTDEPIEEELPAFERELARRIEACVELESQGGLDLSGISWKNMCERIMEI